MRNIDDDKTTKKQLNEEQLKDLADRLKEAEARLPSALTTAYRHILVPAEKKTLRSFDMGIGTFSGRTTLSSKVLEKLSVEQQILDKLDPAIMIGPRFGLWPDDQELINVKTLADYFTQLTHLPQAPQCPRAARILGERRRARAVRLRLGRRREAAVRHDPLQPQRNDGERLRDHRLGVAPAARAGQVVDSRAQGTGNRGSRRRRGEARPGGRSRAAAAEGGGEGEWKPGGGQVKIVEGERRLSRVRIKMDNLPWENWNDIYNEVIDPLAQEGAEVRCDVILIAKGDAAIRENTIELGIKESLAQRGIQADIQTG